MKSIGMMLCLTQVSHADTPAIYADRSNAANLVVNRDYDALTKALAAGSDPNGKDYRGEPALMLAVSTNQYNAANLLLDYGADLWYADKLGFTAAIFTYGDKDMTWSKPESQAAYSRFVDRLKQANYPWPPPNPVQMQAMLQAGQWPPANAVRVVPIKFPVK